MIVRNTLIIIALNFIALSLSSFAMAKDDTLPVLVEKAAINKSIETAASNSKIPESGSLENKSSKNKTPIKSVVKNQNPEVGKHVMANMDSTSMIISLLMVLALIILSAYILKRFKLVQQGGGHLKVIASLSLGAKERVIVIQSGEKQLMLGVTPSQITLIEQLEVPIETPSLATPELGGSILSVFKKTNK